MKHPYLALAALALLQAQDPSHYTRQAPLHSAADILESAIKALAPVKSVEYEVRTLPASRVLQPAIVLRGRTTVVGMVGLPYRYRARYQADDPPAVELAVSDGEKVRISAKGKLEEYRTRTMEDSASAGALPTLQLFDPEIYRRALASKNVLYAGQDDIEGELCYVIGTSALFPDEVGSDTFYYWISARTGLPRSRQTYRILHGKTLLTYQWIVSNIRINPTIQPDTFHYHPTAADSLTVPAAVEPAPTKSEASPVGRSVPDLEARDSEYQPVSLARIAKGRATILTLWATWCGPCIGEFPAFQKLVDRYPDKLQVVALMVEDSRLSGLNFIKKHPEYRFTFLTDPNLEESQSKIARFFTGEGIPRTAFVDPQGRIVDYVVNSFESHEEDLMRRVSGLIGQ